MLFVINNLHCGGAEKALISLLETIDYNSYNVDLYVFQHEGIFFNKIPKQVNVLKEPSYYKYFDMSIKKAIIDAAKNGRIDLVISRLQAGILFRTESNDAIREQKVWKYAEKSLVALQKEYDVAIGFLEKSPIYFCLDKVKAKKKIGFVHNDYDKLGMDPSLDQPYFEKLDYIVTVSEECVKVLKARFPEYSYKISLLYNIISPKVIWDMANAPIEMQDKGTRIVSVGRLHYQKGFELAIAACKRLVSQGYPVTWYVIGEGEERSKLQYQISEYGLQKNFILLGLRENPYPYIKSADLYVQPSRFEGKSIAIDEAKILCKPIVVTNFSTARDQITHGLNGIITEMTVDGLSLGIKDLIENKQLQEQLIHNLRNEKLGTETEIQKLYAMCK